jgi:glycosyltransferase involved in cell wall biosynthesis
MLTALAARIPLVLRGETWQSERKSRWRRALLNTLFRRVAAFAAVGSRNAGFYLDAGVPADRIFIAPYSVDSGFFASAAKTTLATRHERRRRAGIEPEELLVLFSGKLVARKNPLIIVDAIARCKRKTRMVMLAVGDGELRAALMQAADRLGVRLRIAGFKNQSELPAMYALADVIVLPSPVEPWGLVINEAMYFGLPAIVTDAVGASADLVQDGVTGFVIGSGDAEQLAARLDLLAASPELAGGMGQAARNKIASWGIPEAAAGIEAACRYACNRRAADGEECAA